MKIFVLAAFDLEINPIVRAFHLIKSNQFGFTKRWTCKRFDLLQTNIGKVNAAATTQYLIDHEHPDWIINVGFCGGFTKKATVGDIFIPTEVIQYDMDQTKFGFPLGRIHGLEKITFSLEPIRLKTVAHKTGICISADKLLSDKKEGTKLYRLFHPSVVDMELGAIAHVCLLNKTRLSALKSPVDIVEKEEIRSFASRAHIGVCNLIAALEETLDYLSYKSMHLQ